MIDVIPSDVSTEKNSVSSKQLPALSWKAVPYVQANGRLTFPTFKTEHYTSLASQKTEIYTRSAEVVTFQEKLDA